MPTALCLTHSSFSALQGESGLFQPQDVPTPGQPLHLG